MTLTLLVTAFLVSLAVLIHFEALQYLATLMRTYLGRPRVGLLLGVLGALLAHVVEISVFSLGYIALAGLEDYGSIEGGFEIGFRDGWYFSAVIYSTLGFGDLYPKGPIRFLTGMEALTGLVLITWTASFLYLYMQQIWRTNSDLKNPQDTRKEI